MKKGTLPVHAVIDFRKKIGFSDKSVDVRVFPTHKSER
jgi:hypothetical protein